MSISFRPAVRQSVNLLIGLAGASGAGKSFSAFRLASGIAAGKRFAVIDTENGRASHYADQFAFDVAELREPFTPHAYSEAIAAADAAGYPVIVVDSMSHEYSGTGGVLDMQEEEFARLGHRDSSKLLSWALPKAKHKNMMQKLLQVKAHLILCFRAESKIEIIKEDGKTKIVPKQSLIGLDGWIPITEKTVPFELTVSLMLIPDHPGVPHPIKLQQQHRALFPLDKPITEESGRRIAEWAAGDGHVSAPPSTPAASPGLSASVASSEGANLFISADQVIELGDLCKDNAIKVESLLKRQEVASLARIPAAKYAAAKEWLTQAIEYKQKGAKI